MSRWNSSRKNFEDHRWAGGDRDLERKTYVACNPAHAGMFNHNTHMNLTPLNDQVIVRANKPDDQTSGGIVIPAAVNRDPVLRGVVIAVGAGKVSKVTGERIPPVVSPGDEVVFGKYSGQEIVVDGEELLVMEEYGIFAIVNK